MRRRPTFFALLAAAFLTLAGVAFAAHALPGKTYSGSGQEYENNGPHFETFKGFRRHMTLTVSSSGTVVEHFKGSYTYYCGAGTAYVTGHRVKINSSGRFGGTGSSPSYARGQRTGTNYYVLRGKFIDAGHKAAVTYQDAFVGTGQKDPNPYSLRYQSPNDSCQNKVIATIPVT